MAALVRLLAPLDIAAPAVRTAVSRMVRQGWLAPARLPRGPGYEVTPKCVHRLDEAALRIYRVGTITWNGRWHILVVEPVRERSRRERLRSDLAFIGYAPLSETTWIGPRPSPSWTRSSTARASPSTGSTRCSTVTPPRWSPGPGIWTASGPPTRSGWPRRWTWSARCPTTRAATRCSPPGAGCCTAGATSCSAIPGSPRSSCRGAGRGEGQDLLRARGRTAAPGRRRLRRPPPWRGVAEAAVRESRHEGHREDRRRSRRESRGEGHREQNEAPEPLAEPRAGRGPGGSSGRAGASGRSIR